MRFMAIVKATKDLRSRQNALRGAAFGHGEVQRGDVRGCRAPSQAGRTDCREALVR